MSIINKLAPMAVLLAVGACTGQSADTAPKVSMTWENVNQLDTATHRATFVQTLTFTGDLRNVKRVAFNQFKRGFEMVDPTDTLIELLPGYYAIGSPKFANATGNDTIVFQIKGNGTLAQVSYGPDGVHTVLNDGTTEAVNLIVGDMLANPA